MNARCRPFEVSVFSPDLYSPSHGLLFFSSSSSCWGGPSTRRWFRPGSRSRSGALFLTRRSVGREMRLGPGPGPGPNLVNLEVVNFWRGGPLVASAASKRQAPPSRWFQQQLAQGVCSLWPVSGFCYWSFWWCGTGCTGYQIFPALCTVLLYPRSQCGAQVPCDAPVVPCGDCVGVWSPARAAGCNGIAVLGIWDCWAGYCKERKGA